MRNKIFLLEITFHLPFIGSRQPAPESILVLIAGVYPGLLPDDCGQFLSRETDRDPVEGNSEVALPLYLCCQHRAVLNDNCGPSLGLA